jgi:hypothetical protein
MDHQADVGRLLDRQFGGHRILEKPATTAISVLLPTAYPLLS